MGLVTDVRKLAQRSRIVTGTTTANWNSGVATSGLAGADLLVVGEANLWYRLNLGVVLLTGLNVAATITIREYMDVMGANRLLLTDNYSPPIDPLVFLGWWLDAEFYGTYRIELASDQAADDGFAVAWEYRIKDW